MIRKLLAACTIAQLAGCVVVPTHVNIPAPTAAIGRIKVVVPLPDVGAHAMYVGGVPWHYARLTLTPEGGGTPLVATLSSYRGDLSANGPIDGLRPGAYLAHVDLIQVTARGSELVVASGDLPSQQLALGNGNSLELMVHPTELGSHLALTPTSLPSYAAPYYNATTIINQTTIYDRREIYEQTVEVRADEELEVEDVQEDEGWSDEDWADWDSEDTSYDGDAPADDSDDDDRT
jgi:hypothetical protein